MHQVLHKYINHVIKTSPLLIPLEKEYRSPMKKVLSSNVEDLLLNVVYHAAVIEFLLQNPGLSGKESPFSSSTSSSSSLSSHSLRKIETLSGGLSCRPSSVRRTRSRHKRVGFRVGSLIAACSSSLRQLC